MYADLVIADTPTVWWPMDDASTTLRELVAGANATPFGSGHAVRQQGLPFPSVSVAGGGGWNYTPSLAMVGASYTMECWAIFNSFVAADISEILAISGAGGVGWRRFLRAGQGTTTTAFMDSAQTATSSGTAFASAAGSLTAGVPYHLAVTYSGTTGTAYINGVAGTPSTVSNTTPADVTSMFGWIAGGWSNDNTLWRSNAKFAQMAMYGSALSAARIAEHYRVGRREGVQGGGYG